MGYTTSIDFWTLGVCAYHWSTKEMPFGPTEDEEADALDHKKAKHKLKKKVNKKILKGKYDDTPIIGTGIDGIESLCKELFKRNEEKRLGFRAGGYAELKKHPFFKTLDWGRLEAGALPAPIEPRSDQMNVPNTADMDMKKVNAYEKQRADKDDIDQFFGKQASKWDYVCSTTAVPQSYVDFLEKRAVEAAKLEKTAEPSTLFSKLSDPTSSMDLEDVLAMGLPKDSGIPSTGGGGGEGGCCSLM